MRGGVLVAAAAVVAACTVTAGCGQQQAGSPAAGQSTGSAASPATRTPSGSGAGSPTGPAAHCLKPTFRGPGRTFTLTNAANGKTFCVKRGTRLYVFLRGSTSRRWSPIRPQPAILARLPSGVFTLMVGETGGYFLANHTGTADLISTRSPCLQKHALCNRQSSFRVTLVITG